MVHVINLGVGLILAGVLVIAFCQRHKWTNGKSIFGHLLKGKIGDLVGKAQRKRGDHKTEASSLEEGTGKNYKVETEESESDNVDVGDETKEAQHNGFLTKDLDENNCKEQEEVELPEAGKSLKHVAAAAIEQPYGREEGGNVSTEETDLNKG